MKLFKWRFWNRRRRYCLSPLINLVPRSLFPGFGKRPRTRFPPNATRAWQAKGDARSLAVWDVARLSKWRACSLPSWPSEPKTHEASTRILHYLATWYLLSSIYLDIDRHNLQHSYYTVLLSGYVFKLPKKEKTTKSQSYWILMKRKQIQ